MPSAKDISSVSFESDQGSGVAPRNTEVISVNSMSFSDFDLSSIDVKSGGVGNSLTCLQDAISNIDSRLVNLRAYTAIISDTISNSGDLNLDDLSSVVNDGLSSIKGGRFILKSGTYNISDTAPSWDLPISLQATGPLGTRTTLQLAATKTSSIEILGAVELVGVSLDTAAGGDYLFDVKSSFVFDGRQSGPAADQTVLGAGCLKLNSSSTVCNVLENFVSASNNVSTNGFGLEITTNAQTTLRNVSLSHIPDVSPAPAAVLYIHDTTDAHLVVENCKFTTTGAHDAVKFAANTNSKVVFRNCEFIGTNTGKALVLDSPQGSITFDNCRFASFINDTVYITGATGDVVFNNCSFRCTSNILDFSLAVNVQDSYGVVFDSCEFISMQGSVRATNAGVIFRDCNISCINDLAGNATPPQLLAGYGWTSVGEDSRPLVIENCTVVYNRQNITYNFTTDTSVIELGGFDATAMPGRVLVDGLSIYPDPVGIQSTFGYHNNTMFLFRGNSHTRYQASVFKRVCIDMGGVAPKSSGGTLQNSRGAGASSILEVIGNDVGVGGGGGDEVVPGILSGGCEVIDLEIRNVLGAYGGAETRNILHAEFASIKGAKITGDPVTTDSTLGATLVELQKCDVQGMYLDPGFMSQTSAMTAALLHLDCTVVDSSLIRRNSASTLNPGTGWILMTGSSGSSLSNTSIHFKSTGSLNAPLVYSEAPNSSIRGCWIVSKTTISTYPLISSAASGDDFAVTSNTVCWSSSDAENILDISTARPVVVGNKFCSTSAVSPTIGAGGVDGVNSGNLLTNSVSTSIPLR